MERSGGADRLTGAAQSLQGFHKLARRYNRSSAGPDFLASRSTCFCIGLNSNKPCYQICRILVRRCDHHRSSGGVGELSQTLQAEQENIKVSEPRPRVRVAAMRARREERRERARKEGEERASGGQVVIDTSHHCTARHLETISQFQPPNLSTKHSNSPTLYTLLLSGERNLDCTVSLN